jgi:hypothetical protein
LPGERNPQSAAEEFAPPPQGENVLDASMMAELIVTKKEIAPQLQKSTGTSRATPKGHGAGGQRLSLTGRRRAEHSILWFSGSGALLAAGSLPQFGRRLKGRSGRTRRRGHRSSKAIRKIGDTGSASGAVTRWPRHDLRGIGVACGCVGLVVTASVANTSDLLQTSLSFLDTDPFEEC